MNACESKKTGYANLIWQIAAIFMITSCLSGQGNYDNEQNKIRNYTDYPHPQRSVFYRFDYKVGDRFALKKTLVLCHSGYPRIRLPGFDFPDLDDYLKNPELGKDYHVIDVLPKGTVLKLVAIKDNPPISAGVSEQFEIEGLQSWSGRRTYTTFFAKSIRQYGHQSKTSYKKGYFTNYYNRDLYQKLDR